MIKYIKKLKLKDKAEFLVSIFCTHRCFDGLVKKFTDTISSLGRGLDVADSVDLLC